MKKTVELVAPRSRTDGLVIQVLAEEVLVYDRHRNRAHCLNQTAATIWNRCDGKTTVPEICALMAEEFKMPMAEQAVGLALAQLRQARLLDDEPVALSSSPFPAMSRREVMRRVGLAAAVALPMVTSIIAPKAVQAATCRPNGDTCSGNGNCCSHNCVGGICIP